MKANRHRTRRRRDDRPSGAGRPTDGGQRIPGRAHPRRHHDRAGIAQHRGADRGQATGGRRDRRRDRRAVRMAGASAPWATRPAGAARRRTGCRCRPRRRLPTSRRTATRAGRPSSSSRRRPITASGVDLHTDETLDPAVRGLVDLAELVSAGFDHQVTASHCVSLGMQPADEQRAIAEAVAAAGIGVIALPHTNLFLQGRGRHPMPRGLTAVDSAAACRGRGRRWGRQPAGSVQPGRPGVSVRDRRPDGHDEPPTSPRSVGIGERRRRCGHRGRTSGDRGRVAGGSRRGSRGYHPRGHRVRAGRSHRVEKRSASRRMTNRPTESTHHVTQHHVTQHHVTQHHVTRCQEISRCP